MPEPSPDDLNEREFAELLAPGIRELRANRGPCPSSEELLAFYENRSAKEDVARLQAHVGACGLCDVRLGRLDRTGELRPPSIWERARVFVSRPAFAYTLAALLSIPAYLGLVHMAGISPSSRASVAPEPPSTSNIASIRSLSLDVSRAVESPPEIVLSADDALFVLSFFLPIHTSPQRYEMQVVGPGGAAVLPAKALTKCDTAGNCALLCDARLFRGGAYELRVTPAGAERPLSAFAFEVKRQ